MLRLGWSTDGMNIISAHATNEGRPVAQIIDRKEDQKSSTYLAGHTRPVVCVVRPFSSGTVVALIVIFMYIL